MATESASVPVNGNYTTSQGQNYAANEQSYVNTITNANANATNYNANQSDPPNANEKGANGGTTDIPKAEVGWYFVEKYYTTLSRNPEKLHLFYNKRSQFVSGVEAEKISVCVGLKPINDRIKELKYQDCKVRVTNVDSQGSDQNIIIQVIGEISNNSAPHRKFVQTFVLAGQTNGYFVLNDIFRYITDEEEMEDDTLQPEQVHAQDRKGYREPPPTANSEAKQEILTSSNDPAAIEHDAARVDKQLTTVIENDMKQQEKEPNDSKMNGSIEKQDDGLSDKEGEPKGGGKKLAGPGKTMDGSRPTEQPQADDSQVKSANKDAPVATKPSADAAAPPSDPPKVAAPKTWANLAAAANRVAIPAVPAPTGTPPLQSQPRTPAAGTQPAQQPVSNTPTETANADQPTNGQGPSAGWQTAGSDNNRRQARPVQQQGNDSTIARAYIKNLAESIDAEELKATLSKYGELARFEVILPKHCAFVDFANLAGYQAAVAANPHQIGNNTINVEEKRPRSVNLFQRGGMNRGRGGPDMRNGGTGRGGFNKEGGRGYSGRGRGGMPGNRGRGGGQNA